MRVTRRPKEPPLRHRQLWRRLRAAEVPDVPQILRDHYSPRMFGVTIKGEPGTDLGTWSDCFSRCDAWLKGWLESHSVRIDFSDAYVRPEDEPWKTRTFTIPDSGDTEEVGLVLEFLACVLDNSRLRVSMHNVDDLSSTLRDGTRTVSLLLNSPDASVVLAALTALQHFATAFQRLQHRAQPMHGGRSMLDPTSVHKVVCLAAGWHGQPSPLQYDAADAGAVPPAGEQTVRCDFFRSTYRTGGAACSPTAAARPELQEPEGPQPDWCTRSVSAAGEVTVTIDTPRALAAHPGPNSARAVLQWAAARERLPFRHCCPLWSRLRMAAQCSSSEQRQLWACCRMLALAVLAETAEADLRQLLQHCADWFQDVTKVLGDPAAPPRVLTAVLGLLHALLSSITAREALNSADLRGSALSHSRISASQGRLTEMLIAAPQVLAQPHCLGPDGVLRSDVQLLYVALCSHAQVFAISHLRGSGQRTLNTAILDPVLRIPRLRIPGVERVGVRCLALLESILAQDAIKEQAVQVGLTEPLISIVTEELANMQQAAGAAAAAPPATDGALPEELTEAVWRRGEAARRIPAEREAILSQALRALWLCVGTSEGLPSKLMDTPLQQALHTVLADPAAAGYPVFKHAVDLLCRMTNQDPTSCPALISAGFLDLALNVLTNDSLHDPHFVMAMPPLVAAFCLNAKGIELVKKQSVLQLLLRPVTGGQWHVVVAHDAVQLGGELEAFVRQHRCLYDSLGSDTLKALGDAVSAAMSWTPDGGRRSLRVLHNLVCLCEPLLKIAGDRLFGGGKNQAVPLLRVAARLGHFLAGAITDPVQRQYASELRGDILLLLSAGAHSTSLKEVLDDASVLLGRVGELLAAKHPALWATEVAADGPKGKTTLFPPDWKGRVALPAAASCIGDLLQIVAALQGSSSSRPEDIYSRRSGDRAVAAFLAEWLRDSRQWQENFDTLTRLFVKCSAELDPFCDDTVAPESAAESSSAPPNPLAREGTARAAAVAGAALGAVSAALLAEEERRDPAGAQLRRMCAQYCDAFGKFVGILNRASAVRSDFSRDADLSPPMRKAAGLLARLAQMQLEAWGDGTPEGTPAGSLRYLAKALSAPGTGIHEVLFTAGCRGSPRVVVLLAFSQNEGISKLATLCRNLIARALDIPSGEAAPAGLAACAAHGAALLLCLSSATGITNHPHSAALQKADDKFDAQAFAQLTQRAVAEAMLPLCEHAALAKRTNLALLCFEAVANLVGGFEAATGGAERQKAERSGALAMMLGPSRQEERAFEPDPAIVERLHDMGFPRGRIRAALRAISSNSVEGAMEWVLAHMGEDVAGEDEPEPEESAPAAKDSDAMEVDKDPEQLAKEAKEAAEAEAARDADPVRKLVARSASWAMDMIQAGADEAVYCVADLLCHLAEKCPSRRAEVLSAVISAAEGQAAAPSPGKAWRCLMAQLSLLVLQPAMAAVRGELTRSAHFFPALAAQLRACTTSPAACDPKHAERAEWEAALSAILGLLDAITLPPGEGALPGSGGSPPRASSPEGEKPKEGATEGGDATAAAAKAEPDPEQPPWHILLSSPGEPLSLPEPAARQVAEAALPLLQGQLTQCIAVQLLSVLSRVSRHHSVAALLFKQGALPALLDVKIEGGSTGTMAPAMGVILRNMIEDPQYIQAEQEAALCKAYARVMTEAEAGTREDAVEWVPRIPQPPESGAAARPEPEAPAGDRKRKRTPAKKSGAKTPRRAGAGKPDSDQGEAAAEEAERDEDARGAGAQVKDTEQVQAVKLHSLLPELEQQKARSPQCFLQALAATCRLIRRRRKEGDKAVLLVELRPGAARRHQQAGRRQQATQTAESVVTTLTAHFLSSCGGEPRGVICPAQELRFAGEVIARFPSCAAAFLALQGPGGLGSARLLLSQTLPYSASPAGAVTPAGLAAQAARFVLQQLALKEPQRVSPDIVQELTAAAGAEQQRVGAVHALHDLLHVLTRSVSSGRTPAAKQLCSRLMDAGVVGAVCACIRAFDFHHPDAAEVVSSMLLAAAQLVRFGHELRSEADGKGPAQLGGGDAEADAGHDVPEDSAAVDAEMDVDGGGTQGPGPHEVHVEVQIQQGGGSDDGSSSSDDDDEDDEEDDDEEDEDLGRHYIEQAGEGSGAEGGAGRVGDEDQEGEGDGGGAAYPEDFDQGDDEDGGEGDGDEDEDGLEDEGEDEEGWETDWEITARPPAGVGGMGLMGVDVGGLMRGILADMREEGGGVLPPGLPPDFFHRMVMHGAPHLGGPGDPFGSPDEVRVVQSGQGGAREIVYWRHGRGQPGRAGAGAGGRGAGRGLVSLQQAPPLSPAWRMSPPGEYRPRALQLHSRQQRAPQPRSPDGIPELPMSWGEMTRQRQPAQPKPSQSRLSYSADAVDEAVGAFLTHQGGGALVDLVVSENPTAPSGDPPEVLQVTCEHRHSKVRACGGEYRLLRGQTANGNAIWESTGGAHWLYCTPGGRWKVTDAKSDFPKGAGFLASREPHNGQWPHQIVAWQVRGSGSGGISVKRVALPPPQEKKEEKQEQKDEEKKREEKPEEKKDEKKEEKKEDQSAAPAPAPAPAAAAPAAAAPAAAAPPPAPPLAPAAMTEDEDLDAQLAQALAMSMDDVGGSQGAEPAAPPAAADDAGAAPPAPAPPAEAAAPPPAAPAPASAPAPQGSGDALADELGRALAMLSSGPGQPGAADGAHPAGGSQRPTADTLLSILSDSLQATARAAEAPAAADAPAAAGAPAAAEAPAAAADAAAPAAAAPAPPPEPALDPTFVAALPDDLRQEVLRENIQLLMTASTPQQCDGAPEGGSTVNPIFLAALPPSIQGEVIQLERQVLRQQEQSRAAAAASASGGGGPTDMDPATFIQTLSTELRQDILATADDELIGQLPPDIAAEAHAIRELRERRWRERERMAAAAAAAQQRAGELSAGHQFHPFGGAPGGVPRYGTATRLHPHRQGAGRGGHGVPGGPAAAGRQRGAKKEKEPEGVQVLDTAVLPALVRVLYMAQYGAGRSGQLLRDNHSKLLHLASRHDETCRRLCTLLLLVLGNGDGEPPPDIPEAGQCVMPQLYNVPSHLTGAAPAPPLVVPPLVMLRAIETIAGLAEGRAATLSAPGEQALAVLAAESAAPADCIRACEQSFLFRLLCLLYSPAFASSPKLGEALTKLLATLASTLTGTVAFERARRVRKLRRAAARERLAAVAEQMAAEEKAIMTALDADRGGASPTEPPKYEPFTELHKKWKAEWAQIAERHRGLLRQRVGEAQPSLTERFAAYLFTHPPTLSSIAQVLENSETTETAVGHCITVLTDMTVCGATLPDPKGAEQTVRVPERVLAQLLESAWRVGARAAQGMVARSGRVSEAWRQHLISCGIDPAAAAAAPGSPRREGGAAGAGRPAVLPAGARRFFLGDEVLREGAPAEAHLQRLAVTLQKVVSAYRTAVVAARSELPGDGDGPASEMPEKDLLQGRWRTDDGRVAVVTDLTATFTGHDGVPCPNPVEVQSNGSVRLTESRLVSKTRNTLIWSDGDLWRRADAELLVDVPHLPEFRKALEPAWHAVDEYLLAIGRVLRMDSAFQPPPGVERLAEAFFVFHEIDAQLHPGDSGAPASGMPQRQPSGAGMPGRQLSGAHTGLTHSASNLSLPDCGDENPVRHFIVSHRRLLNALVRANPSLLTTSLKALMEHSSYVDFHNKRTWFREQVKRDQEGHPRQSVSLKVRRSAIFHESFRHITSKPASQLKGRMRVVFKGEEGVDGGGLTREWFQVLAKDMFNPDYALFIPSREGNTFQPNPQSSINVEHLSYFRFVGRVIGLAVYNDVMLDAYFTRSFYKYMLDIPVDYHDIQSIDPDFFKSLKWMLENPIDGFIFESFSIEEDVFGRTQVADLKPGGRDIQVTDQNKKEYVQLITQHRMVKAIETQLQEFCKGFYEVVPRHLVRIFGPDELELLICGMPTIDLADMKSNTDYVGYSVGSPQIVWFWSVLEEMENEELLAFMQFVTGSSKVPLTGFKDLEGMSGKQKLNIHRVGEPHRLPTAHTCFNQLDLPEYDSRETLRDMMNKAIVYGKFGFGFV